MSAEAMPGETSALRARLLALEEKLEESEGALHAIRHGDVDAVVVSRSAGNYRVYALENADRPYRLLIEQFQEGAVTLSEDGTMLYGNRRLAAMLGVPQEAVLGQQLQDFMAPTDATRFVEMLAEAKHGRSRDELTLRSRLGGDLPAYVSISFLQSEDNATVLCGVLTDLSEQKNHLREVAEANARLLKEIAERAKIETALRHAQKMEAIGQLSAGVAHDFNNILQSIVGGLELVLDDVEAGGLAHQFATVAINAAMRGTSLTHHLLSYARKQMLRPQAVEMKSLLAEMEVLLARTLGPRIAILTSAEQPAAALVDPGQLQTALLNLAINASHAMPGGGSLSMVARAESEAGQDWVVLTTTDTGVGMDEATLARAVDPFFTTKGLDGSGLGLSMVQGFVEQSGGRLRLASTPGQGTSVELRLPAAAAIRAAERAEPPAGRALTRVLLVDDAPDVLATTGAFLEKSGFTVARADGGDKALALLAGGARFDAMVSDYAMPGLNGAVLIAEARIVQPGLKAVLITGYAGVNAGDALPEGVQVLHKPFQRAKLVETLRALLAGDSHGETRLAVSEDLALLRLRNE